MTSGFGTRNYGIAVVQHYVPCKGTDVQHFSVNEQSIKAGLGAHHFHFKSCMSMCFAMHS